MQAYERLLLRDAGAMLGFDEQHALLAFCRAQGWHVDGQYVIFRKDAPKAAARASADVIHNMLNYVRELDRII